MPLDLTVFHDQFARFRRLVAAEGKDQPFTNFQEGAAAVWEGYKTRLRDHALELLAADGWSAGQVGGGVILQHVVDAIEIQDSRVTLTNNLVFWQNRFGHANRDHRVLLEAQTDPHLRRESEDLIFSLYRGGEDEGAIFDRLSQLIGAKYPLLAYLFFLKDMDRFMPIQPTTFDRAFRHLGIDLVTLRDCSWDNYRRYNAALGEVRGALAAIEGLSKVRLVDAHSFCWMLETLKEPDEGGGKAGRKDSGRILGGREAAIIAMRYSIENTVRNANGQIVERTLKNKETGLSSAEIDKLLEHLLDLQGNRCALTGIPFDFAKDGDKNLFASPDRIDSSGHYVLGNIQVVCRFINFWKGSSDNEEFKRLLMQVRGGEAN